MMKSKANPIKRIAAMILALALVISVGFTAASCSKESTETKSKKSKSAVTLDAKDPTSEPDAKESTDEPDEEYVSWPSGGLFDVLPKPESDDVVINQQSDEYISVEVHNTTQEDFTEYVDKLRDMGYKDRQDKQIADHVFNAVDGKGYEIMSSVAGVSEIMYIQFKSPESSLKF